MFRFRRRPRSQGAVTRVHVFPSFRLFIAGVLIVIIVALVLFLQRTRMGLRLRAAVQDPEMIAALGTNTQVLYMFNFGMGILLRALRACSRRAC